MVVDAVVRHWVAVMVEGVEEQGYRGQEVRHNNALFYADNVMVASLDPRWLQGAFSILVGLFDRVGLWTNSRETVGMVCRPFQAVGTQLEAAYGQWMTVEGPSYREWQKGRMQFRECGDDIATGSMLGHMKTKHGQAAEDSWSWTILVTGEEPCTYRMAFPAKGGRGYARLRGARDERRRGRQCSSIFCIGMSGTPWSFWRRKTSPTQGAPMRYSGPLALVEQKLPFHRTLFQRERAEEKSVSGGGIEGDLREGLSGIWISTVV